MQTYTAFHQNVQGRWSDVRQSEKMAAMAVAEHRCETRGHAERFYTACSGVGRRRLRRKDRPGLSWNALQKGQELGPDKATHERLETLFPSAQPLPTEAPRDGNPRPGFV